MTSSRSKPIQPPLGADGKPKSGATLKEWTVPKGHDTQWQASAHELDMMQTQVPAELHIFNKAEIWKLCPLKGCRRARQCTGTVRDQTIDGRPGMILGRPPCIRPRHLFGEAASGKQAGQNVRQQFTACWEAHREVMHILREQMVALVKGGGAL